MRALRRIIKWAGLVIGPLLYFGALALDAWDVIALGIPRLAWEAIGGAIFFAAGFAILWGVYKENRQLRRNLDQLQAGGDKTGLIGDVMVVTTPGEGRDGLTPLSVVFTTEGKPARLIRIRARPRALLFVTLDRQIVGEGDLPKEIPCGRGKLVIKEFTDIGFVVEERNTIGERLKVEYYI